jgi:hypothetical protein
MRVTSRAALARAAQLTEPHRQSLSAEHSQMLAIIRTRASADTAVAAART